MRPNSTPTWVASLAVGLALCAGVSSATPKAEPIRVREGTLRGTVTSSDGKSLPNVSVWLMAGEKVVAKGASDREGRYALQDLKAGRFDLHVADQRPMRIVVAPDAGPTTLNIVLPERAGYGAMPATQWVWAGGGAAVVAAVAVPVVLNNTGDGGEERRVSP